MSSSFSSFPFACCLRAFLVFFKLLTFAIYLAPLVAAVPRPITFPSLGSLSNKPANSSTSLSPHAVTFAVPCPGCFQGPADAALPFELVHEYTSRECENVSLTLNGQDFVLDFIDDVAQTTLRVPTADRTVDVSIQGYCDQVQSSSNPPSRQVLFFDIDPLDGIAHDNIPSFTVVLNASVQAEALVIPHPHPDTRCLSLDSEIDIESVLFSPEEDPVAESDNDVSRRDNVRSINPDNLDDLPAKELRKRFDEERELIRNLTMDCRAKLIDDLRECKHDVQCSGEAICHHFRNAIKNLLANIKSSLHQSPLVSDERQWQAIVADEKNANYGSIPSPDSSDSSDISSFDKRSIIILALEILAGVLGIGTLVSCIRCHCQPLRRKIWKRERLADREERKRAREYRRLARKEAFRKKWVAFKRVFAHFPCKRHGCEEKQALVVEAAAFATREDVTVGDLEQALDATFSQDYLASNAERSTLSRYHKDIGSRSRSDSLPSYGSEKLPDYSSQPDGEIFIVGGRRVYTPSLTASSSNSAITPDSSIPDLSPRCSRETLRTLMSRD